MIYTRAVMTGLALALIALPSLGRAQYIDPICAPWQEVEGNGCRTKPFAFAIGGAACVLPIGALVVLARRRRSSGRGE